ncbi:ABC transporter ATP-binding protein [Microvirga alba]|uniref:ABC transporter ATP-binding protein n=1 Tax=Microvirga alba TaxID=2791025 RepID=A0A931BV88_9HYPH|nr:ABC transporter ATP-binding protein [Microvirga alba]MBF9235334.1 ABC transporter ATP-binding protein [Microvirga alba]
MTSIVLNAKKEVGAVQLAEPILDIRNLNVGFARNRLIAIDALDLTVRRGEIVALVGESGSGKSMTALTAMRLLPVGAGIISGEVRVHGRDLLALPPSAMNAVRGREIAMLYQQPKIMLDPTATIGRQIAEPLQIHRGLSLKDAWPHVIEALRDVGIPEPERRAMSYAHQLSGGMAQRVMIAAALSASPDILIADEPTTALDVTVQAQILKLLVRKRDEASLAVLLITHDLMVVSAIADRVAVMYAGRIVEEGETRAVLRSPRHPYTQALLRSSLLAAEEDGRLYAIPGSASAARGLSCGCRYHPRCQAARSLGIEERCRSQEPSLSTASASPGHQSRCWGVQVTAGGMQ